MHYLHFHVSATQTSYSFWVCLMWQYFFFCSTEKLQSKLFLKMVLFLNPESNSRLCWLYCCSLYRSWDPYIKFPDCFPGPNTLTYSDLQPESLTPMSLWIVSHGSDPVLCCFLILIPKLSLLCQLFSFSTQLLWPMWIALNSVKVSESPREKLNFQILQFGSEVQNQLLELGPGNLHWRVFMHKQTENVCTGDTFTWSRCPWGLLLAHQLLGGRELVIILWCHFD